MWVLSLSAAFLAFWRRLGGVWALALCVSALRQFRQQAQNKQAHSPQPTGLPGSALKKKKGGWRLQYRSTAVWQWGLGLGGGPRVWQHHRLLFVCFLGHPDPAAANKTKPGNAGSRQGFALITTALL
jgi:hypothetical protein